MNQCTNSDQKCLGALWNPRMLLGTSISIEITPTPWQRHHIMAGVLPARPSMVTMVTTIVTVTTSRKFLRQPTQHPNHPTLRRIRYQKTGEKVQNAAHVSGKHASYIYNRSLSSSSEQGFQTSRRPWPQRTRNVRLPIECPTKRHPQIDATKFLCSNRYLARPLMH